MRRTEILRKLIDNSGMSVKAFALKAGLPYSTLRSMLERGIGNASVDNVIKVCKALGITIEELEEMAIDETLEIYVKEHNNIKEDPEALGFNEFKSPETAIEFILKQPAMAAYGGYDINEMTNEEIVEFANELLRQLKLLGYKYKK